MGVYVSWATMRVSALKRLSSKAEFPSSAETSTLLDKVEAGDAAAIAKVAELRKSMSKSVKPDDEADKSLWAGVLELIDKHAT
ncbi:hypothetical protein BDR05DRAFT_1006088 [Suillus weaverae]|nr:hypothetical protein BDR05DRAFT_1006088 [Suillus weaverae]